MIRLIIADDHAIVRGGLKQLFALSTDITVVGEAENSQQLLSFLDENAVDLVLLDLTMPDLGGVEMISRIRGQYPALPILILSMHNELQIVSRALKTGANGYLTKDNDPETLLTAIRRVAGDGRFIDPKLAEKMVFEFESSEPSKPHEKLSEREFQILQLLAKGQSLNDIGRDLAISNKTVSTYKARLFEKLHISNNAELIRYYDAHRLNM
ncbi:response regulator transcription factor [Methylomonas sp. EFPC1]|uniref:Response regulator transcription factor n=1 Tax=Methylomonas defluvii TaxID=3045149 RepID=A0ABU4U8P0_9GAMM|nr:MULTISPECIES: response regulator transcription factor [unclassified Methylomonas]MDX8125795.1 response regulator transcription factor [Methylomonas sp. OY6]QBC25890.1 DNA-binding response regulator [Methylomonas sp. LW13]QSB01801.1 response regulator transcription factor [Methylomonas sp. EFPC1]